MSARSVRRIVVAALGAGALVGAVGIGSVVMAASHDVAISGFAFSPETITIKTGDTVRWTNSDGANHTATADDDSFNTGTLSNGESGTATFSTAGTFAYHCTIHSSMTGTVVVTDASVRAPATDADAPERVPSGADAAVPAILLALAAFVGLAIGRRRFAGGGRG